MKIGIIGAGRVGSALGKGWAEAGHLVSFGVRDQGNYKDLNKWQMYQSNPLMM